MNCTRTTHRHGWNLVEVLIAIAMTSVITGLVVTLLAALFQHDRRAARLVNEEVTLARLADQFRSDVRQATSITAEQEEHDDLGAPPQIALTLAGDTRVVYRQRSERLLRTVYKADQPRLEERYFLPEGTRVELHELPSGAGEMATLMLDYPLRPEPESKHRQRLITAALGRDLQWSTAVEEDTP